MNIYFSNNCNYVVFLNIDETKPIFLQPFETKVIARNDWDVINILIKRTCESQKKASIYHLVIETEYVFSCVSDNTVFTITREKIQFCLNATYDRLFIHSTNAEKKSEKQKVLSEDKMKSAFNKAQQVEFLFDTIMSSSKLIVILLLVGISLTIIFSWKIAVVYFPLAFLFVAVLNWLIHKFSIAIGKKVFKEDDEKTAFYQYFENDYINNYYSDLNRTPFWGNSEE